MKEEEEEEEEQEEEEEEEEEGRQIPFPFFSGSLRLCEAPLMWCMRPFGGLYGGLILRLGVLAPGPAGIFDWWQP